MVRDDHWKEPSAQSEPEPAVRQEVRAAGDAYAAGRDQYINVDQQVLPVEALRPTEQVDAPAKLINVPGARGIFLGREPELAALEDAGRDSAGMVITAMHGLGGIGKSALAARYATAASAGGEVNPVWWINADAPETIQDGLAGLAAALQPELKDALPLEALAERALGWLASHAGWLLVLDNVTDPAHIEVVTARTTSGGKVLVTSRLSEGWDQLDAPPLRLGVLEAAQAVELLTRIVVGGQANTRRANADVDGAESDGAMELVEALGCLPLAITQAAAYLHQTRITPRAYLNLLKQAPDRILDRAACGRNPDRTIARIWRVTLDQITATTPLAGGLLRVLAWYAPDSIPRALLIPRSSEGGAEEEMVAVEVNDALGELAAYNMITLGPDTISVHRLVQALARTPDVPRPGREDQADPHRRPDAIATSRMFAARQLRNTCPADVDDPREWPVWRALLPHVDALTEHVTPASDTLDTATLCNYVGAFLLKQFASSRAIAYLQRSLDSYHRLYGPKHLLTLNSRSGLALAYQTEGKLGEAISLHEELVADCVRALGSHDSFTQFFRCNLAGAYLADRNPRRAIPLYERALPDLLQKMGDDNAQILVIRGNLAAAYQEAGNLTRALPLLKQLVADCERVLGNNHPQTMWSRSNLASTYGEDENPAEALPLLKQALADFLEVADEDHPYSLNVRNNLAHAYQETGDIAGSIPLREQLVTECERVLGVDHPHTLHCRNELAGAYRKAGDLARAIPLFERALADRERLLGPLHIDTFKSRLGLAAAYGAAGDLARAIPLLKQVLAVSPQIMGEDDPLTEEIHTLLKMTRQRLKQPR